MSWGPNLASKGQASFLDALETFRPAQRAELAPMPCHFCEGPQGPGGASESPRALASLPGEGARSPARELVPNEVWNPLCWNSTERVDLLSEELIPDMEVPDAFSEASRKGSSDAPVSSCRIMDSLTVSTITASDNYDHNGPYPNDLAGVIIDRPTDDSPPTNELTTANAEARINESPYPNDLAGVIIDRPTDDSSPTNELTTANPEARINESPHPDDLVEVVIDTDTDDIPHTSELTGGTKEACIYESVSERLSRFEDYENAEYVASYDNKIKKIVHSIVSSFAIGIFGVFLILLDVALIFADLIFTDSNVYIPLEYRSISLAIALFFLMDVLLRVFVEGRQHYFSDLLNILDTAITVIILLVDVIYIFFDVKFLKDVPRWTRLFRLLRLIILIRVFHLAHLQRQLGKLIRRLVSGNKRRYKRDGFDLDLTYITERIIAMSFPSSGGQSFYRNPIKEVVQFLDKKHPNHYRVYNLCSERAYDPKHFHNRVSRIMIDDHNVPTLWEMVAFSKEVEEWLAQDPENIIVIHCKGGKENTSNKK
ncbi:phosphatidylinositol 3,4,5-trisphosphate 3-phosphatase TPTE2-like [Theropithecus gelada]|uniref:phosphatidylinositol 3,4,5-trisphosphate 3-phosphatase TPTE2-like n=1 Tax=Theropithecus gelada TaxID=9565 RepID=UPI000DC1AE62|nr:phosphatidylinositol 3,4,5-trisphosphate 3-phosphatase TPTE2-like [Theropithecus gelada]